MAFHFQITGDYGLVELILSNPRAYKLMANDEAPPLEGFKVDPRGYKPVICRSEDGMLVGLFVLVPRSSRSAEVHFCFVPGAVWKMIPAGKAFIEWVWHTTLLNQMIGKCPSYNPVALRVAKACGFAPRWSEPQPARKDGQPFDLTVTTLHRPN